MRIKMERKTERKLRWLQTWEIQQLVFFAFTSFVVPINCGSIHQEMAKKIFAALLEKSNYLIAIFDVKKYFINKKNEILW